MRRMLAALAGAALIGASAAEPGMTREAHDPEGAAVRLPAPHDEGATLNRVLNARRSVRSYARGALSLTEVAQLLWAAQGVTARDGSRTAPSAGALYPLELYVAAGEVRDLAPGVYRDLPDEHQLLPVVEGDLRRALCSAALAQEPVAEGAVVFVLTAVEHRTTHKYGSRGVRYVHIEVGHAAQNLLLQATALGLGSVPVGAFDDGAVTRVLQLPGGEVPLYLVPVGRR